MLITSAVLAAVPALALSHGDSFGATRTHRLDVPGWPLAGLTPERIESGNVDGDGARDICLLLRDETSGFGHAVAFLDVAEVIAPQVLSDGASDVSIVPSGWLGGPGAVVANGSGLELFTLTANNVLHGVVLSGSNGFIDCTDLSVVVVGNALGFVGLNPSGQVVRGTWESGVFSFDGARTHAGIQSVAALTWHADELAYAFADGGSVHVYDSDTGIWIQSSTVDPGTCVMRAQTRPDDTDRLVCMTELAQTTRLWVIEPGQPVVPVPLLATGRSVTDMDFGDFDDDGHEDLLVSIGNHSEAWVLYGDNWGAQPAFSLQFNVDGRPFVADLAVPIDGNRMTVGDFDGDLDVDIFYVQAVTNLELVSRDNRINRSFDVMPALGVETVEKLNDRLSGTYAYFDFRGKIFLPDRAASLGLDVIGDADGVRVDVFIQETPTSQCPRTPWFTDTLPIVDGQNLTGILIEELITSAQVDGVFLFRIQHVVGQEPLGAPLHFSFSFDDNNLNAASGSDNWSVFELDGDGTNQAGEHNQRGSTSPPEPPPA